jgi:hypothetical protein
MSPSPSSGLRPELPVIDRQPWGGAYRQVKDLPRIGVAEPLPRYRPIKLDPAHQVSIRSGEFREKSNEAGTVRVSGWVKALPYPTC